MAMSRESWGPRTSFDWMFCSPTLQAKLYTGHSKIGDFILWSHSGSVPLLITLDMTTPAMVLCLSCTQMTGLYRRHTKQCLIPKIDVPVAWDEILCQPSRYGCPWPCTNWLLHWLPKQSFCTLGDSSDSFIFLSIILLLPWKNEYSLNNVFIRYFMVSI